MLVLNPPPIRGLSTAGGFTFVLQNRGGADTAELSRVLQGLLAEARKRPEIGFVYSGFDPRIPQIEFRGRPRQSQVAGHPVERRVLRAADLPRQLLHQRLQSVRAHLPRPGPGGGGAARPARRRQPLLRAHRRRDDGAALHAGEQPAAQRSAVFRALQRLQRRHHQRNQRAGLQLRPGHRGDGGARARSARRASPTSGARRRTRRRRPAARPATSSRCRCCS